MESEKFYTSFAVFKNKIKKNKNKKILNFSNEFLFC